MLFPYELKLSVVHAMIMNMPSNGLISKSQVYICISSVSISCGSHGSVKNGKNGKPHVLTLQNMEDDNLQFDLATETVEERFEWYQVAWDITQREMSKQYNRQHEVSISWHIIFVVGGEPILCIITLVQTKSNDRI